MKNTLTSIEERTRSFWTTWRLDWLAIEAYANESQEEYAYKGFSQFVTDIAEQSREEGATMAMEYIEETLEQARTQFLSAIEKLKV